MSEHRRNYASVMHAMTKVDGNKPLTLNSNTIHCTAFVTHIYNTKLINKSKACKSVPLRHAGTKGDRV
jgi:hypothetical protein